MQLWHLTLASASRMTLFPTSALRLAAAVCIARVLGPCLLLFAIVDDHVHVLIACARADLAARRSALSRALASIAVASLAPTHVRPVETRAHLQRCVRYFLEQSAHHGLDVDLALDPGSCFQDLVGARCLPGFDPRRLKRALPRVTRADLLSIVGLPASAVEPAKPEDLRRAGITLIVRAAAGAVGAPVELIGRTARVVQARRASAHLCDEARLSRRDLLRALGASSAAIRRLAHEPVPAPLLRAARIRVSLLAARVLSAAA
jgi:hypothetical protein